MEKKFDGVLFIAGDEINFGIEAHEKRMTKKRNSPEIKRRHFEEKGNMAKFCDDTNKVGLP